MKDSKLTTMNSKFLQKILEEYEATTLDIEQLVEKTSSTTHMPFQIKRLKKNNDRFRTEIQGGGTGDD